MNTPTLTQWKHLEGKPGSAYRQLFVKGTRIMARLLYGLRVNEQEPMTCEEIAAAYDLPVDAVAEAIAYCESDPPEIRADWEMEEASIRELVQKNPQYIHPAMTNPPKIVS
jgi:uncharacterized protein (DUF433 family)